MRLAIDLLRAAVRDILDNPGAALRVSAVPMLILTFGGGRFLAEAARVQQGGWFVPGRFDPWLWGAGIALTVIPSLWIAVGWHRFVILGEAPSWFVTRRAGGRWVAYGGAYLAILLVVALLGILLTLVLRLAGAALRWDPAGFGPTAAVALRAIGDAGGVILFSYLVLRFAPTAVGAACGRHVPLAAAWDATGRGRWAILLVLLGVMGLAWLFERIVQGLSMTGLVLGGYELASAWFLVMLNVGILTTIHARFAEPGPRAPRPLGATPPQAAE